MDDKVKVTQSEIVASIKQTININTELGRFQRGESFQDTCIKRFPSINYHEKGRLDRAHVNDIGVLVCRISWDPDQQITVLEVLESYVGKLGRTKGSIDRKINEKSQYIRMYKNIKIPIETDFFVVNDQTLTSLGMDANECSKYINYKTSIIDPIQHMLESVYSDVDSLQIDTILDCGLTSIGFAAYVDKTQDGESFKDNPEVTTRINWATHEYSMDEHIDDCVKVWNEITKMFGDFCKNVRGDCVYLADGPRILNLMRNYPIRNYIPMENIDMFNKFLPLFNGNTNNYVARYWNWVFMEDMQYANRGIWVPGSVVMGSQLVSNDMNGEVWYAPAGQSRG